MKIIQSKKDIESLEFGEQFVISVGIDPEKPGEETEQQLADQLALLELVNKKFQVDPVEHECRRVEESKDAS